MSTGRKLQTWANGVHQDAKVIPIANEQNCFKELPYLKSFREAKRGFTTLTESPRFHSCNVIINTAKISQNYYCDTVSLQTYKMLPVIFTFSFVHWLFLPFMAHELYFNECKEMERESVTISVKKGAKNYTNRIFCFYGVIPALRCITLTNLGKWVQNEIDKDLRRAFSDII